MFPGAIIAVAIGKETVYGQVLAVERDRLRMKMLFTDELAYLYDIHKSYRQGIIWLAFKGKKDVVDLCKTIVYYQSSDERFDPAYFSAPSWHSRVWMWLNRGNFKLRWAHRKGVPKQRWCPRFKIKGVLCADGWFLPFSGQITTKSIYFAHHNTLKQWQSITSHR